MIRTARIVLTVLAALATFELFPPSASARPYNQSSHPPEFFRDLLSGRVFIHRTHRDDGRALHLNPHPVARYHAPDGRVLVCWFSRNKNNFVRSSSDLKWKIGTRAGPSNYQTEWTVPAPKSWRAVIIYTPKTGRFHMENHFGDTRQWAVSRDGWLQDSWPKAMADACPHMGLPYDLPIDEYQDSLSFEHMKANASPVRNHPGSDVRFPGATGIGDAGNKPTTTPEQFHAAIRAFHGFVLRSNKGRWQLFNMLPDRPELWLLDSDRDLIDAGTLSLTEDGTLLTVTWDLLDTTQHDLHVGYPIPLLSTSKLHPAYAMMKDLAGSPQPLPLAGEDADPVPHVFRPDGTLTAGNSTGSWRISKGAIHVETAGISRAFPWREFAKIAGWKK